MKTALLLTNSAETQRLLTDILTEKTNIVLLPPPSEPSQEQFDSLFSTWVRLVDAVILDAASLGETSRWAIDSLEGLTLQEHQAVIVRVTAAQQLAATMSAGWLLVSDTDSPERLKQALGTFFELRDAQSKLKRVDAVMARQRQAPTPLTTITPPSRSMTPSSAFPSFDA